MDGDRLTTERLAEVMRFAMNEHCLKQTGKTQADHAARRMTEDATLRSEPTM